MATKNILSPMQNPSPVPKKKHPLAYYHIMKSGYLGTLKIGIFLHVLCPYQESKIFLQELPLGLSGNKPN